MSWYPELSPQHEVHQRIDDSHYWRRTGNEFSLLGAIGRSVGVQPKLRSSIREKVLHGRPLCNGCHIVDV